MIFCMCLFAYILMRFVQGIKGKKKNISQYNRTQILRYFSFLITQYRQWMIILWWLCEGHCLKYTTSHRAIWTKQHEKPKEGTTTTTTSTKDSFIHKNWLNRFQLCVYCANQIIRAQCNNLSVVCLFPFCRRMLFLSSLSLSSSSLLLLLIFFYFRLFSCGANVDIYEI